MPPSVQTARTQPAVGNAFAVSAGVKNIPLPMMPPTTRSAAEKRPSSRRSSGRSDNNQLPLDLIRRDDQLSLSDVGIHFRSHPQFSREIDPRLDRKSDPGNQGALVARLEVVEIRAGAVKRAEIDRVAGAVGGR